MKKTLLFLAAGMGSRYGGLKQLDQFGPHGETLMEYSVYDGIRAGFEKIIFVIRRDFESDFKKAFIDKIKDKVEVDYVFQELTNIPAEFSVPEGREKPWGTGHAILVARQKIDGPFAVLNADDYYGPKAYEIMYAFLNGLKATDQKQYCIAGYPLKKTLSDHGAVSRGVCDMDNAGNLVEVKERLKIARSDGKILYQENDQAFPLDEDTLVSMNLMGFATSFFDHLETQFTDFLKTSGREMKTEFLLPSVVNDLVVSGQVNVKVLKTDAQWFGVTYQEDRPIVMDNIKALIANGTYPARLW